MKVDARSPSHRGREPSGVLSSPHEEEVVNARVPPKGWENLPFRLFIIVTAVETACDVRRLAAPGQRVEVPD
jgi:hypothetical protein